MSDQITVHVVTLNDLCNSLQGLINDAAENIKAIGGCDHSVGICICDEIQRLENARAALHAARRVHTEQDLPDLLDQVCDYLDARADADCEDGRYIPNNAMRLLTELKKARGLGR